MTPVKPNRSYVCVFRVYTVEEHKTGFHVCFESQRINSYYKTPTFMSMVDFEQASVGFR